ncbi:DUF5060 domain-containing protein [Spirosoma montaniterrae]|uniref:DUF4038 domain-containing protein n=1 Tax=Spirosoma montaniterrae TaxID=1178516 RepID=A0A1P9WRJ2_9BACT|nr:DUF5060 domain-containing protein [Spirosoma montaniterrae]AQG77988.1 hypothetical protein AWR27_00660 [Spirosoma montaniterrae]
MKRCQLIISFLLGLIAVQCQLQAQSVPERVLVQDALAGQTTGKPQGAGAFVEAGGWRSAGGRIIYDAGEAIERGYFEATIRGMTLPAVGAAKSNILSAWESGEPFKSGKEKGSNWMLRIGTSCHLKMLAFSDGSGTRYEVNVPDVTVRGEAHRYRMEWNRGRLTYTIDGKRLGEFPFARMSLRYFVIGLDNSFVSDALTDPAPIISDVRLVSQSEPMPTTPVATEVVERYGIFDKIFIGNSSQTTDSQTKAMFTRHAGGTYEIPLFPDGANGWRFRFSPDSPGRWTWRIQSADARLNGQTGVFTCVPSDNRGGVIVKGHAPGRELTYQNGRPYWLMGETNWAAFRAEPTENLTFDTFRQYVDKRVGQGFTFLQTALLPGGSNEGGKPFLDRAMTQPNLAYWQAIDRRVNYLNQKGITPLLVLAWGDRQNPLGATAWSDFADQTARERYAAYVIARYSAYNVAFGIAADWNKTDDSPTQAARMDRLGTLMQQTDPHHRWITILGDAGKEAGSVSRFAGASWMSFYDFRNSLQNLYVRNYTYQIPQKITVHTGYAPVDATPDAFRHATWDVVMAGNYPVTAFADTYLGGLQFGGKFGADSAAQRVKFEQLALLRHFFEEVAPNGNGRGEWSWIKPFHRSFRADTLIRAAIGRSADGPRHTPPTVMHSVLAKEGKGFTAVVYMRGQAGPHTLTPLHDPLDPAPKLTQRLHSIHRYNPRTGEYVHERDVTGTSATLTLTPPDAQDWVFVVQRKNVFDPLAAK